MERFARKSTVDSTFYVFDDIYYKRYIMNTNKKGDIGLVKTMSDLVSKGYFIFTPLSDTTCVDLVVANDSMTLKKLQVKYCSLTNGRMCISTSTVVNGKKIPIDLSKIDIWALYCPDNDKVYYLDTKILVGKKTMNLRVVESIQNKNINYASDYESLENIWKVD